MFQTSHPVTGATFHDRTAELDRLATFVAELRAGANRWLAVIGPRKVGKTSLILELSRRITDVDFIMVDTQEASPPSLELFRTSALRVVDRLLGHELDGSLEVVAAVGGNLDQALDASATFATLPASLRTTIRALARAEMTDDFARLCLDLPERMAEALDRHLVVAIDEFQELASLTRADVLPVIRSAWQRHRRVGYVVSGSGRTLLEGMVTREQSPFFQHFTLMYVGPFSRADAIALLADESVPGRRIPVALAERAVTVLGGHPFYLQLIGEALTAREPPYDEAALKEAFQDVLFSRTGRLALYLQLGFDRIVGRSTYLAALLDALCDGPLRVTDIASRIHASTADTARYLERVGDAVRKRDDGRYELDDPVFGIWLRWRRPGGTVVPMTMIGDAAERDVATLLARMGFDLVYQSRASRGAFDLLATRGASQLGIQVKRSPPPLSFSRAAWQRMSADAKRLGWRWAIASVDPAGAVVFLDPAKARRGQTVRLGKPASIESLVAWLDA
jgi:AAA+ ATPase superfamily predicted ATPase/Holliday junction resolvase